MRTPTQDILDLYSSPDFAIETIGSVGDECYWALTVLPSEEEQREGLRVYVPGYSTWSPPDAMLCKPGWYTVVCTEHEGTNGTHHASKEEAMQYWYSVRDTYKLYTMFHRYAKLEVSDEELYTASKLHFGERSEK